ncbi:MAG TPA: tetratricopeptide repeat protein [Sphingomicrobium sp.]|nr:tetratricopeptide repeat protein [Sphingomicrobium sp.]
MALAPGETSDTFIREVDENLRRSQAEDFFRRWGVLLIIAVLLLLAAAGGYLWWQSRQQAKTAEQSEQLAAVIGDVASGNTRTADARLMQIAADGGDYGALAQMTAAALALQTGNRPKALQTYQQVAADKDQPEAVRDAALLRQTALEFDGMKPEAVIARLQPYAQPGNPWFGTAGEMTAMAMLKQNRRAQAGRLFGQLAAEKTLPQSIRSRAVQIAGTLGVDATAQLPGA